MRFQPTTQAQVSLNGKAVSVTPGIADSSGRQPPALAVTITVQLDTDDAAAALLSFIQDGGTLDEIDSDADAWLALADTIVNNGLGPSLVASREQLDADDAAPFARICRDRAARLLAAGTAAERHVPALSRSRELAVSR